MSTIPSNQANGKAGNSRLVETLTNQRTREQEVNEAGSSNQPAETSLLGDRTTEVSKYFSCVQNAANNAGSCVVINVRDVMNWLAGNCFVPSPRIFGAMLSLTFLTTSITFYVLAGKQCNYPWFPLSIPFFFLSPSGLLICLMSNSPNTHGPACCSCLRTKGGSNGYESV